MSTKFGISYDKIIRVTQTRSTQFFSELRRIGPNDPSYEPLEREFCWFPAKRFMRYIQWRSPSEFIFFLVNDKYPEDLVRYMMTNILDNEHI